MKGLHFLETRFQACFKDPLSEWLRKACFQACVKGPHVVAKRGLFLGLYGGAKSGLFPGLYGVAKRGLFPGLYGAA